MKSHFVRRINGEQYLFNILLVAIATVLLTRIYLDLTNYPTIGGDLLHVAHVLWGGLLMIVANILSLSFHGKKVRIWASIIAGVGFGLFIDEVGKFVTHDNNYFFKPAVVIIYLTFILLFVVYSWTKNNRVTSPKGILYNNLELIEEVLEKDFENHEKERIIQDLDEVIKSKEKPYANFARDLKKIIIPLKTVQKNRNFLETWWSRTRNLHKYFGKRPLFATMTLLLAINGVGSIINGIALIIMIFLNQEEVLNQIGVQNLNTPLVYATGISLLSAIISAIFVIKGIYSLYKKQRTKALQYFKKGLITRILITHIFTFYFEQFGATISVLIDVIFYFAVEYLLDTTQDLNKKTTKNPA